MGGLGLCDPSSIADFEFDASVSITSPLIHDIIQQRTKFSAEVLSDQHRAKVDVVSSQHQRQASRVSELMSLLSGDLCRIVQLSSEKGASSWLSVLPIEENGFALHKGAFRDALCLKYGWLPSGLPTKCVYGHGFTVNHAMNCSCGGFLFYVIMNLGISLQLYCLRFVMMLLWSQFCSHCLGNLFDMHCQCRG